MENSQIARLNNDLNNLTTGKLTDAEKLIVISSVGQKTITATDDQIRKMLLRLFLKIGLKELPNEAEKQVLVDGVKKILKNYTVEDIENAFDAAMLGTIQFDLRLYDRTFCIVFLSDLMRVYESYRSATMIKYMTAIEEAKRSEESPSEEVRKRRNYESVKKGCLDLFDKCKKCAVPICDIDVSPKNCRYEFLTSLGLFNYSQSQVDDFRTKAKTIIGNENLSRVKKENIYKEIITRSQAEKDKLDSYIKNSMVLDYFNALIVSGRELKTEIGKAENK